MTLVALGASLHPLERKVLPHIHGTVSVAALCSLTSLSDVEVMRAVQWLEQKKVVYLSTATEHVASLGPLGCSYVQEKLPEVRFLHALVAHSPLLFSVLQQQAHLSRDEMSISLGLLKRLGAIGTKQEHHELQILVTSQGRTLFAQEFPQQHLLEKVAHESRYTTYTAAEKTLFSEKHCAPKPHKIIHANFPDG